MFLHPQLMRHLRHRSPTVGQMIIQAQHILAPCPPSMLTNFFSQERNLKKSPERIEAPSGKGSHKTYTNRHGEEIAFTPCSPLPGYVFVPSGNLFITRSCRKLAKKVFAVYRPRSRKRLAAQIGLHVPRDTFNMVESDFETRRAKTEEILRRHIDRHYPRIPSADKKELYRLISSQNLNYIGKSTHDHCNTLIYRYVRNQYTRFKSLRRYAGTWDAEAMARIHQKVEEIMASYRGVLSQDASIPQGKQSTFAPTEQASTNPSPKV